MSEVTKRTVAENNMIASAKLALIAATSGATGGDCDNDGFVEPVPFDAAGVGAAPTGGGYLPSSIGAALNDPWDTRYGYCVWDHGAVTTGCTGLNYLAGINAATGYSIAIISAGPDRQFATTCAAYPTATALNKTPGTDDIVLGYTYSEASALSGGLWNIKDGDADTAQIARNLEVKDSGGNTTFALDADTGMGDFIGIMTGSIAGKSGPLDITGGLKFEDTGIAVNGVCTQTDAFAFDGTADQLVRCNGTNWIPAGGSDNLGNHIATQNIQLGSNWLTGDAAGNDGIQINAAGAVTTSGLLTVGGNAAVTGTLGVTGATSLTTLGTSGLATLNSASVTGNASVGGTFGVVGNTSLTTLTSSSAATLDSLVVNNDADIKGSLWVDKDGDSTLITRHIQGKSNTSSAADDLHLNWNVSEPVYIGGGTGTSNLIVSGDVDLTGGRINNMLDPLALQDAATKSYVDARVASGTGFTEADPQVGILQATKWCVGSADGSAINCDQNAPSGAGDNLGNHIATLNVRLHKTTGPTGNLIAGTGDNLGSHTATQTLDMGGYPINNSGNITVGGVGTSYELQLHDSGTNRVDMQISNSITGSTATDGFVVSMTDNDVSLSNRESGYMGFNINSTERMRLTANGDLEHYKNLLLRDGNGANSKTAGLLSWDDTLYFRRHDTAGTYEANVANLNLTTGTFTATAFVGDGSGLTGIAGSGDNLGNHIATTVLRSDTHNTDDFGTTAIRWKDGWFAGAVTAGSFVGSGASLTGITSAGITDSTITNADIATGGVTTLEILDSTIVSADIAADTIGPGDIAADAVGASELAANAVASANIVDGTIVAADIANGTITAAKLAAGVGGVSAQQTKSCSVGTGSTCTTAACDAGYIRTGCSGSANSGGAAAAAPSGANACICTGFLHSGGFETTLTCYLYCAQ